MAWILWLHVLGAVFIIGPVAVLPMTALRSIRNGDAKSVRGFGRTVSVLGWLTLVVAALGGAGFAALGDAVQAKLGTGWLIGSAVLTVIAVVLTVAVVAPQLNAAAREMESAGTGADAPGSSHGVVLAKNSHYAPVAMTSGIVALLLVAVAILMVVR